ncbi:hypothetical protein CIB48_g8052 [Xylaria polymorpha]|nr:hypothetical protein CIB48_g8052 [Xylaria polymorpha]
MSHTPRDLEGLSGWGDQYTQVLATSLELGWNVRLFLSSGIVSSFAGFYQQADYLTVGQVCRDIDLCFTPPEHAWPCALLAQRTDLIIDLDVNDTTIFPTPPPSKCDDYYYVLNNPACLSRNKPHNLDNSCVRPADRPQQRFDDRYLPIGIEPSDELLRIVPLRGKKRRLTPSRKRNISPDRCVNDDDDFPESIISEGEARPIINEFSPLDCRVLSQTYSDSAMYASSLAQEDNPSTPVMLPVRRATKATRRAEHNAAKAIANLNCNGTKAQANMASGLQSSRGVYTRFLATRSTYVSGVTFSLLGAHTQERPNIDQAEVPAGSRHVGGHLLDAACERVQAVVRLLKNIEGMCSSILESVKASGIHTKLKPANSSSNIADSIIIFTVIAFLKLVLVIIVAIVVIIVILVPANNVKDVLLDPEKRRRYNHFIQNDPPPRKAETFDEDFAQNAFDNDSDEGIPEQNDD